ncbi:MAG: glycoside hydrolase family 30 protein [Mariniphaga sp.]|nr:glycoside hydrolase family 30 protein [Mariniphaga sp.]
MKKLLLSLTIGVMAFSVSAQKKIEWISTTESSQWVIQKGLTAVPASGKSDVEILLEKPLQTIEGFGACFNELGWTSLNSLEKADRESILKELFAPGVGGNFTICRMPVAANDFARDWYSYNETEGDFEMKNFSIANDFQTLVPFIKNARQYNPALKIWASPWSPPSWMKWNKHYACASTGADIDKKFQNGLDKTKQGKEGANQFIQKDEYFKAYALYFSKFIKAYRDQGINIAAVMPQNEFNSCQIFPSCTWTSAGLAKFIGSYLGPAMEKENVEIMFGTMERPNIALVDTIINDALAGKYIKGIGFQWAGKKAIADAHQKYPNMRLYQSEQECGDGKNDWKYCSYAWTLMKHYLDNGANAYMYWNLSLDKDGFSRWGWRQNSLVSVDLLKKTYTYNFEYYLLKHVSHFVMPGARLLETNETKANLLAFINPDKSIVVIVRNDEKADKKINLKIGEIAINQLLKADSFNTFVVK